MTGVVLNIICRGYHLYHRDVGTFQLVSCPGTRSRQLNGEHNLCTVPSICICLEVSCFNSLQPVSVSVPHPKLHCICSGWHSWLNYMTEFAPQVCFVSPVSSLAAPLWDGQTVWCCNTRHCGLEAGTPCPLG